MSFLNSNLALIAQAADAEVAAGPWYEATWFKVFAVLAVLLVPLVLAQLVASGLRMRDYTTKLYLIFFAVSAGVFIVSTGQIKKDIDLAGGTQLIYELDKSKLTPGATVDMDQLIASLRRRVDPAGVKQTRIRAYGAEQVEITIPEVDPEEVRQLKRSISQAGVLEFRILAHPAVNTTVVERAQAKRPHEMEVRDGEINADKDDLFAEELIEQAKALGEDQKSFRRDVDGVTAAWVPKTGEHDEIINASPNHPLVTRTVNGATEVLVIRDRLRARWIEAEKDPDSDDPSVTRVTPNPAVNVFRPRPDGGLDFLVVIDHLNVNGVESAASASNQQEGGWLVNFNFDPARAEKFGRLTTANLPDDETGRARLLGIVLDGQLLSAPAIRATITSSGQISGDFSKSETQWLASVLNAGSLPAALAENPISEQSQSPTLGQDTIDQGRRAITISFFAVMIFMPLYYRFGGLVAAFALTLNLVLVLAIMMLFKARFSLPGMAGLVLTVGMAVDANVLIFERIREELNRGSALRMAIRNGFDRATRTIVDANVTTLITGIVLYVIGSEQIKGFAITLILGIAMSMFTAIFCSRVIFEIAEKKRWLKQFNIMRLFGETNIDFLSKRNLAGFCSIVLIALGLFAVFSRGTDMLAIDFTGGSKLQVIAIEDQDPEELLTLLLEESPKYAESQRPTDLLIQNYSDTEDKETGTKTSFEVLSNTFPNAAEQIAKLAFKNDATVTLNQGTNTYRIALDRVVSKADVEKAVEAGTEAYQESLLLSPQDTTVNVTTEDRELADDDNDPNTPPPTEEVITISLETKQPNVAVVQETVTRAFAGRLKSNQLRFNAASFVDIEDAPATGDTSLIDTAPPTINALTTTPVLAQPEEGNAAITESDDSTAEEAPVTEEAAATETPAADETPATEAPTTETPGAPVGPVAPVGEPAAEAAPVAQPSRFAGGTQADLKFDIALNQPTLHTYIEEVMRETGIAGDFMVSHPEVQQGQSNAKKEWKFESVLDKESTGKLLAAVSAKMKSQPVFPSANSMGSLVAGNQQSDAWGALVASLVFIVGYIWIRFQRVIYGLAAVVALVHDVLITLGILALSGYIAQVAFFHDVLLVEHFKISLEILAAFLTIIGYSLNDTIVVFDRIREVRGKSPDLTAGMINKSINQTLSRTVLTSLTTLIVVAILYAIGGAGIHGFAFALVTGVMVGTYSSVFVASPTLLWLSRTNLNVPDDVSEPATAGATAS